MKMLRITLEGKTYEVGVEILDENVPASSSASHAQAAPMQSGVSPATTSPVTGSAVPSATPAASAEGWLAVVSPMAGHVFKCLVKPGDEVAQNQKLIILDAMKMETPVVASVAGIVRSVMVKEGDSVDDGCALLQLEVLPR